MKAYEYFIGLLLAGLVLIPQAALSGEVSGNCEKAGSPSQLEGRVVKVDIERGKISIQEANGTIHEFEASKETLEEYKAGDTIKAKLRCN